MPSNLSLGLRVQRERRTGFQAKQNGSMPHAEARKQSAGGVINFNQAWPIARIARTLQPPSNRSRSAALSQIRLDCMIWVAVSISGSRTAGTKITRALRRMGRHGSRADAPPTPSALVPRETIPELSAPQPVHLTIPTSHIPPHTPPSPLPPTAA